jgi:serine/threonine-protein kinase RsbW
MSDAAWNWTVERSFPSQTGAGAGVLEEILAQLSTSQWSEPEIFGVHLALEEALVNAIRHGNCSDPDKWVSVVCKVSADRLWIQICDQGCGFQLEEVPDCTDPDRLDVPSGRGIMLMRNFMSRVEYNADGNCVVMEKERRVG